MDLSQADRDRLSGTRFSDIRHYAETASTNSDVLELGRAGDPEGIVVVADMQTAGRGRRGRSWQAEPGDALLMSVLLRPPALVAPLVTALFAVAAADACGALGVPEGAVAIKWPNDLVAPGIGGLPDRKLAGILAEAEWPARANVSAGWIEPNPAEKVLVSAGIGLNLVRPHVDVAVDTVGLNDLLEAQVERGAVLVEFLEALEGRYRALLDRGPAAVLDPWRERCATIGRSVRVDLGSDDVEGVVAGIDDDGRLVVDTLEGDRRVLAVGDVVHLR